MLGSVSIVSIDHVRGMRESADSVMIGQSYIGRNEADGRTWHNGIG